MAFLSGRASPVGSERFRDRAVEGRKAVKEHFRISGSGLHLSSVGLGTYIGAPDSATDQAVEEAVKTCISSGRVNVLDTAINYRYQRAERSVGRSLRRLVAADKAKRDEIFLATKNGYFAPDGESDLPIEQWVDSELIQTGVLDPTDIVDGCHAMSGSYLQDQFERSRRNLGVECIDLLYLHNAPDAQMPTVGKKEFFRRLEEVIEVYEKFRSDGKLGVYGLATWDCLRRKRADPAYLSLEEVVNLAHRVAGDSHGLRYLQFPFNFAMPEAATLRNQSVNGTPITLFDAAGQLGLDCFTSVPLFQGQLALSGPAVQGLTAAQTAIQLARSAPHSLGPLIGQKRRDHLSENLAISARVPWDPEQFRTMLG